jgi:hypothetical protein
MLLQDYAERAAAYSESSDCIIFEANQNGISFYVFTNIGKWS